MVASSCPARTVGLISEFRQLLVESLVGRFALLQQIGDEGLLAVFKRLRLRQKLLDIVDPVVVRILHRIPFYPQIVPSRLAGGESAQDARTGL